MINKAGLLLLIFLILANSSFSQRSDNNPPEATVAEAKLSFKDIPYLKKAFITTTPTHRKDGIPVGKLGVNGGNKEVILKLAQEIADNK